MWMVLLLLGIPFSHGARQLKLVNDWKSVDFNFPSQFQRDNAVSTSDFIPGMAVPIDVDVHYRGCKKFQSCDGLFNASKILICFRL